MTNTKEQDVVWRTYPGIDFLQANQFGEVRTVDHYTVCKDGRRQFVKGHVLKQKLMKNGYLQVRPSVNGNLVYLSVHRVVASCFLPNPNNLPEINHKDNDPTNNKVNNLEWCDHEYNMAYKEKYGKSAAEVSGRPVFAVNLKTFEVSRFESQHEAARQLGLDQRHIWHVLKGRYNQTGGYWFTEDESETTEEKIQEIKDNMKCRSGVIAIDLKTSKVLRFESQREAERQLGVYHSQIIRVIKGRCKQAGGFWFCYADKHVVEKIRAKFGNEVASKVASQLN